MRRWPTDAMAISSPAATRARISVTKRSMLRLKTGAGTDGIATLTSAARVTRGPDVAKFTIARSERRLAMSSSANGGSSGGASGLSCAGDAGELRDISPLRLGGSGSRRRQRPGFRRDRARLRAFAVRRCDRAVVVFGREAVIDRYDQLCVVDDERRRGHIVADECAVVCERVFVPWGDDDFVDRIDRALIRQREFANALERVAEELEPRRPVGGGREDVDETAAHGELTDRADDVDPIVTELDQAREQRLPVVLRAAPQCERGVAPTVRRRQRLADASVRHAVDARPPSGQPRERFDTCAALGRVEQPAHCAIARSQHVHDVARIVEIEGSVVGEAVGAVGRGAPYDKAAADGTPQRGGERRPSSGCRFGHIGRRPRSDRSRGARQRIGRVRHDSRD